MSYERDGREWRGLVEMPNQDPLTEALYYAAFEFTHAHEWSLDGECGVPAPFEECEFYKVLRRHLRPLINEEEYKKARIEALRAEIKSLEGES